MTREEFEHAKVLFGLLDKYEGEIKRIAFARKTISETAYDDNCVLIDFVNGLGGRNSLYIPRHHVGVMLDSFENDLACKIMETKKKIEALDEVSEEDK